MTMKDRVLAAVEAGAKTAPEIATLIDVTTAVASANLAYLVRTGKVTRVGEQRYHTMGRPCHVYAPAPQEEL